SCARRRQHTRSKRDWRSEVCSSDLKNSNYKKDNFYDLKIIKEKDRDVYLLITTTPFNNLKIETFVVPKSVNTNVECDRNIWLLRSEERRVGNEISKLMKRAYYRNRD